MTSADVLPSLWANFFILVGTGSATLAGLVFVALTINLRGVTRDATHRYRAINMLAGFMSIFLIAALQLMGGQAIVATAIEWLVVAAIALAINTNGYVQAFRMRSSLYALTTVRMVAGTVCYLGQIVGVILLLVHVDAGIYVAAVSLVVTFIYLVSGSWLLFLGTLQSTEQTSADEN